MVKEAQDKRDPFAIALFEALESSYQKTVQVRVDDAITKAARLTQKIPAQEPVDPEIIREHKQKLFFGEYSLEARFFFSDQIDNNIFVFIDRYLANPSEQYAKKITELSNSIVKKAYEEADIKNQDRSIILAQRIKEMAEIAESYSMRMVINKSGSEKTANFILKTDDEQQQQLKKLLNKEFNPVFQCSKGKEAAVYNHNAQLFLKAKNLAERGHPDVAKILRDFCRQIKTILSSRSKTEKDEEEKYTKINSLLLQTKDNPLIQKHRGSLKTLLLNFLLILSGVGALFLLATTETRNSFFYRPVTDTENKIEHFMGTVRDALPLS